MEFFVNIVNENGVPWVIGQGLGIIAIVIGFISYQMHTKRQLLIMQTAVAAIFSLHYLLLGAYSAMSMNIVSVIRNFVYDYRTEKGINSKVIPIAFVVLQAVICAFTWDAWYSVFVLLGLCINTYCMSFSDSQNVRKSILVTSPMVLTYDIFVRSIGGIIYESVAIISSVVGVIRNRGAKEKARI